MFFFPLSKNRYLCILTILLLLVVCLFLNPGRTEAMWFDIWDFKTTNYGVSGVNSLSLYGDYLYVGGFSKLESISRGIIEKRSKQNGLLDKNFGNEGVYFEQEGLSPKSDKISSLAVDNSGIYYAGSNLQSCFGGPAHILRKISFGGILLWSKTFCAFSHQYPIEKIKVFADKVYSLGPVVGSATNGGFMFINMVVDGDQILGPLVTNFPAKAVDFDSGSIFIGGSLLFELGGNTYTVPTLEKRNLSNITNVISTHYFHIQFGNGEIVDIKISGDSIFGIFDDTVTDRTSVIFKINKTNHILASDFGTRNQGYTLLASGQKYIFAGLGDRIRIIETSAHPDFMHLFSLDGSFINKRKFANVSSINATAWEHNSDFVGGVSQDSFWFVANVKNRLEAGDLIKKKHITILRDYNVGVRNYFGLGLYAGNNWNSNTEFGADDPVISDATPIRAAHVRNLLTAYNICLPIPASVLDDLDISKVIRASHFNSIAAQLDGYTSCKKTTVADNAAVSVDHERKQLVFNWYWEGDYLWTKLTGTDNCYGVNWDWTKLSPGEAKEVCKSGCSTCRRKVHFWDDAKTVRVEGRYNPTGTGNWKWDWYVDVNKFWGCTPLIPNAFLNSGNIKGGGTLDQCLSAGGQVAYACDGYNPNTFMCKFEGTDSAFHAVCPSGWTNFSEYTRTYPRFSPNPSVNIGWHQFSNKPVESGAIITAIGCKKQ
ncbi:MAG: hypothetical protein QMD65_03175 [Patescibacteria group bacterium]|nr:hypothetical protein [Patescibacteria group bacterium]